jgi:hypothetical protein
MRNGKRRTHLPGRRESAIDIADKRRQAVHLGSAESASEAIPGAERAGGRSRCCARARGHLGCQGSQTYNMQMVLGCVRCSKGTAADMTGEYEESEKGVERVRRGGRGCETAGRGQAAGNGASRARARWQRAIGRHGTVTQNSKPRANGRPSTAGSLLPGSSSSS